MNSNMLDSFELTQAGKTFFKRNKKYSHRYPAGKNIFVKDRIGNESAYGQVFSVDIDNYRPGAFVLKYMRFPSRNRNAFRNIFENEIAVGADIRLYDRSVGPTVLAYKVTDDYGMYIMNEFSSGRVGYDAVSLYRYIGNSCPSPNSTLIVELKETLLKFYKITQGYHGDLHEGNITVVLRPDKTIYRVWVFDYGAHKKFSSKLPKNCKSLNDVFSIINSEFRANYQSAPEEFQAEFNGLRLRNAPNRQSYRSNYNMLKTSALRKSLFSPISVMKYLSSNSNTNSNGRRTNTPLFTARNSLNSPFFTARSNRSRKRTKISKA